MKGHVRPTLIAVLATAFGVLFFAGGSVAEAEPTGCGSAPTVSTVQPMGTVQPGPDGDWVLQRASGVSYPQQARIRYECDVQAVERTGFDPAKDDGGVPPSEVTAKRTDYLQAEAACFQAHGYLVR